MNENVEQWVVRKNAVESERGVVAAQDWMAARAGAGALARGGNAVDAAVACAFALGATEPWMCGMGGSGYMVVWLAAERRAYMIDFQGVLPMGIDPADYPLDPAMPETLMGFPGVIDDKNVTGYGAITVPGAVAGLGLALEKFGKLGFDTVLDPAIQLAGRGLAVNWFTTLQIALEAADLAKDPAARAIYLPGGHPPRPEQVLPLGGLPGTLRALAENGPREFYEGAVAERLASDLQAGGSRITMDDLAAYEARLEEPLAATHRGATIYTAGAAGRCSVARTPRPGVEANVTSPPLRRARSRALASPRPRPLAPPVTRADVPAISMRSPSNG